MSTPKIVPCGICLEQAISNIIQGVALIETSLSQLADVESQKIQTVINTDGVTKDNLLDVNQSVENMINTITGLEFILQSKLEMFQDYVCD